MRLSEQTSKVQQIEGLKEQLKAIQRNSDLSREKKMELVEAKRAEILAAVEVLSTTEQV